MSKKIAPLRNDLGQFESRADDEARFWKEVQKSDGCWMWIGGTGDYGYGRFWFGHRMVQAHRFSWQLTHGAPPSDRVVCHHCDTPACVNPDHLFLGTQSDNMRDAAAKGRVWRGGRPRNDTHCRRGHLFDSANTIHEDGQRRCRECKNAGLRARRALARLDRLSSGTGKRKAGTR